MDKLRLRNYRCFGDTGDIELKPITLLLGANSSGKSSFIKFFPLLQQSLETRINGLFLWDGPYVDFKNFKNTVKDGNGQIVIDYTIGDLEFSSSYGNKPIFLKDVVVAVTLCEKEAYYDYLKELTISFNRVIVKYVFSKEGKKCSIEANGVKSEVFDDEKVFFESDNNLLPSIRFVYEGNGFKISTLTSQEALNKFNAYFDKEEKTGIELLLSESNSDFEPFDYNTIKKLLLEHNPQTNEEIIDKVFNLQVYYLSGQLIRSVNDYFGRMSRRFSYVLPLRSIMNRYYRFQNRSVDTIDPDGDNLAMFLNSLSDKKLEEFNAWLEGIFKFKIDLDKSEGHVEMYIQETNKPRRNLVDVGFGFTQILPILTIIWKSVYGTPGVGAASRARMVPITIAIEQPELHLHPRFQAFFAEMLAKVISFCKERKVLLRLIIETHSEVIVNKLGLLVYDSSISINKDDINVVLFNASEEGLEKYVHTTSFSDDGGLTNWPFGFFSEDVY